MPQTIDFFETWQERAVESTLYDNAFKVEWELFLRHVVEGGSFRWNLLEGAKGVQLAELGLKSWAERRVIDVPRWQSEARRTPHPNPPRARGEVRAARVRGRLSNMTMLNLPHADGRLAPYMLRAPTPWPPSTAFARNGIASLSRPRTSSAAPLAHVDPWQDAAIDWDATLAYRRYLWSLGFGVAEAMDTAQRGMGLDWSNSLTLIRRSSRRGSRHPRRCRIFGRRHRPSRARTPRRRCRRIVGAYEEQCAAIEAVGGRIILMASRALAAVRQIARRLRATFTAACCRRFARR